MPSWEDDTEHAGDGKEKPAESKPPGPAWSPPPALPAVNTGASAAAAPAREMPAEPPRTNWEDKPEPGPAEQSTATTQPPLVAARAGLFASEDYFQKEKEDELDPEPFQKQGVTKVGLLGGKGAGKSYLFQSIVYRTAGSHSGAIAYFTPQVRLWRSPGLNMPHDKVNVRRFLSAYAQWLRLPTTRREDAVWYRLRLSCPAGLKLFKRSRVEMDIDFLDGSGEAFEGAMEGMADIWQGAFQDAAIMIFCLPLWVLFPGDLKPEDEELRGKLLEGFENVVNKYDQIRNPSIQVRSILALTMADDRRCALRTLRQRWIESYVDQHRKVLSSIKSRRGVPQYLASARAVSNYLYHELEHAPHLESAIPSRVQFGEEKPWLLPVSAVKGDYLESLEKNGGTRPGGREPIPAHVEIPLLYALCDRFNALM
jgi:hypothetical protein